MRPFALLVFPVLLGLVAAQGAARFDAARFELPVGWTQAPVDQVLRLQPAAKNAHVDVARSVAMAGTIDDHGAALVAQAAKLPDYRLEVPAESGFHRRSKGRWHRFVYSYANPDQAGKFRYVTVLTVASGARATTFTMVTDTTASYEEHRLVLGSMVDGVVMTSGQRLERGTPPLSQYMVDEVTDFLEWLVHAPLTADQRATVEAELRRFWKDKAQGEIDGVQEVLAARVELAKLPEAERELARQTVLEQAVAEWQKEPESAGARMMLAIHRAANEPIAKGEPPLTRQAVEAFAEFLTFAAGRTIDHEAQLPKETRDQLVAGVAEGYAELPKDQRELIAGMPMLWAALRVAWPNLGKEQQQAYVDSWKATASIAALGKALAAQKQAAEEAKGWAELARENARRHAALQMQQMHFQTMQNVMRMQQDTMKVMISNLGGNTRYEYRW